MLKKILGKIKESTWFYVISDKWVAANLAMLYLVNQVYLALPPTKFTEERKDPEIQEKMNTAKYAHVYHGNGEEAALKYLRLANAITMKFLRLKKIGLSDIGHDALEKRTGDCAYTTQYTYSNFIYLINRAGKPELCNYVREVRGWVEHRKGETPHAWIEILQDGKWAPYETTGNDLDPYTRINPATIDDLFKNHRVLDRKDLDYKRRCSTRFSEEGKMMHEYNWYEILTGKGLAGSIIDCVLD
ncbi:hypothetical protein KY331_03715 [Candidatus Woesearchaeota archaeon]|nr:hypothetical protein [Candidatus Woesearchaeota archaeon]